MQSEQDNPSAVLTPIKPSSRVTSVGVHWACYGLLAILMIHAVSARVSRSAEASVGDESGEAVANGQIDPNTADWADLATLPGIGEVLAKRIVAYRQSQQAAPETDDPSISRAVFAKPSDLEAVKGIGPKKISALAERLRFDNRSGRAVP